MNEQEITKVLHDLLDNAPANEKQLATPYECGYYDGIEACILAIAPDDPVKLTSAKLWERGKSKAIKEMAQKQGIPVVEHPPVNPDSIDPADFKGLPNIKDSHEREFKLMCKLLSDGQIGTFTFLQWLRNQ